MCACMRVGRRRNRLELRDNETIKIRNSNRGGNATKNAIKYTLTYNTKKLSPLQNEKKKEKQIRDKHSSVFVHYRTIQNVMQNGMSNFVVVIVPLHV